MKWFLSLLFINVVCAGHQYSLVDDLPMVSVVDESLYIGHTWAAEVWDRPLIQRFYHLVKAKRGPCVVIDIGAQTGSFTLLSKYLPDSRWYAFEPLEEAALTLQANLFENQIQNVEVFQMAVSDSCGYATLKLPDKNAWGLSTLGDTPIRFSGNYEQRVVQCINLDSFVADHQIKKVDFIKIDIEGWELNVLRGATKLLLKDRPVILMEYNEVNMRQCGIQKKELHAFLKAIGYTWTLVSAEDILCIPK